MESYLLEHEASLRVSALLLVLAVMAAWERAAPARTPGEPWWRRWRTNHGNVRIPRTIDEVVRALLVTPDMHRVHHSMVAAERNSNYGFCLSVWDRLFGTYVPEPAGGQAALQIGFPGFSDPTVSTTFLGALGAPFRTAGPQEARR